MKISLITSTFNSAETLVETFESVRSQDYAHVEYIVVDGASKDRTMEIVQANLDIIDQWVSEPDAGIYDALNKGIRMATGDIVGFLHSDDIFAHQRVLSQIADAFTRQSVDGVYGDLQYVDRLDADRVVRHWKSQPFEPGLFRKGWMPAHPTFYLKKSVYEKHGMYDTSFRISADYELMLRMLERHKVRVAYIPEVLVLMKVGGESNQSMSNRWLANQEDARAWKINRLTPSWSTRWRKPLSKLGQFFGR